MNPLPFRRWCIPLIAAALTVAAALALAQTGASVPKPKRILLVTGIDHPAHQWRQTWPVLAGALRQDARLEVYTIEDPHFLDSSALARYDAVVLHWQNWMEPGPGEAARANFRKFVEDGKGAVVVHFGCGAWHGEWPDYAKMVGRIWHGAGPGKPQHDPYGSFRVEIAKPEHPITRGMSDFDTTDELYTCLTGDQEIEVLARAKSKVDGKDHVMALVNRFGKGRTFLSTLGHDVKALSTPSAQELYRRGTAWAAGLEPVPSPDR